MASLFISPENQLQRLNILLNDLERLQAMPIAVLTSPPRPKAWSIIEIIAHLNTSYGLYVEKVDRALEQSPDKETENEPFKARTWQRFVINGQRPQGNIRKWKMKTLKKFEPLLDLKNMGPSEVNTVFEIFIGYYGHLRNAILAGRKKDLSKVKVNSAIGPIVNFYLPECFEFLICHTERHWVQIAETEQRVREPFIA